MHPIRYRGQTVALADAERVVLAPDIDALPDGHPDKRFIALMCFYARDVQTGTLPGPYTDQDAERYARACLLSHLKDLEALSDHQAADTLGDLAERTTAARDPLNEDPNAMSSDSLTATLTRTPTRPELLRELWAMTADQRIAAMRRGELTLYQCCAWAARYPDQVPRIHTAQRPGGEFEFLPPSPTEPRDAHD